MTEPKPKGGPRPGAGRPKGSLNKKTQRALVVRNQQLSHEASIYNIGAMEVAEHWMRFFHKEAKKYERIIKGHVFTETDDMEKMAQSVAVRAELHKSIMVLTTRAIEAASIVLPYREARLAPKDQIGTKDNPFVVRITEEMTAKEAQRIYADTLARTDPIEYEPASS